MAEYNRILATLIAGILFLNAGIAGLKNRKYPTDLRSLISMGFGAIQPKSLIGLIETGV